MSGLRRISVLLAWAGLVASAPGAAVYASAQGAPPLKVMTYNIKHGQTNAECTPAPASADAPAPPDCNLDLNAAAAVIRAHAPDIIGLQEIDRFWARSGMQDEVAVLSAAAGLPHQCYAANLDHQVDAHSARPHQYGTLILSRFPIVECSNVLLPRTGANEQRGLTRALIEAAGVRLQVFNTHLHITAADRLLQTERIAEIIDAAGGGPTLLMGDFNARPPAAELAPIYKRFTDAWKQAGKADGDNADGNTSPARLAGPPTARIDYVFASGPVDVQSAAVPIDSSTRLAADHYPVVVTIVLRGTSGAPGPR